LKSLRQFCVIPAERICTQWTERIFPDANGLRWARMSHGHREQRWPGPPGPAISARRSTARTGFSGG
jgi:hypothetical protein